MVPGGGARSATAKPVGLRRILGVGFGLAVIVGSTLGLGILRAPGLVGFVALQSAGLRVSSRFQEVTTAVKFVAFLAVVLAALAFAPARSAGAESALPAPSLAGLVVALQAVVITYGGWQSALYFTEKDRAG